MKPRYEKPPYQPKSILQAQVWMLRHHVLPAFNQQLRIGGVQIPLQIAVLLLSVVTAFAFEIQKQTEYLPVQSLSSQN